MIKIIRSVSLSKLLKFCSVLEQYHGFSVSLNYLHVFCVSFSKFYKKKNKNPMFIVFTVIVCALLPRVQARVLCMVSLQPPGFADSCPFQWGSCTTPSIRLIALFNHSSYSKFFGIIIYFIYDLLYYPKYFQHNFSFFIFAQIF